MDSGKIISDIFSVPVKTPTYTVVQYLIFPSALKYCLQAKLLPFCIWYRIFALEESWRLRAEIMRKHSTASIIQTSLTKRKTSQMT